MQAKSHDESSKLMPGYVGEMNLSENESYYSVNLSRQMGQQNDKFIVHFYAVSRK